MSDWKERLYKERDDLASKLLRLNRFVEDDKAMAALHPHDRFLLSKQANAMNEYMVVLIERCSRLDE